MKTKEKIDKDWYKEKPDPVPFEVSTELRQPETVEQKIKRIIATEISQKAAMKGEETIEEANDFDVEDTFDGDSMMSPYEVQEMTNEVPAGSPVVQETEPDPSPHQGPALTKKKAMELAEEYREKVGYYPQKFMERSGLFDDQEISPNSDDTDTGLPGSPSQGDKK